MTRLYLLKDVPLDPNYETTIDFENAQTQLAYFNKFSDLTFDTTRDYSYLRTNQAIDVPYNFEQLENINYLYYINDNKAYFNFITDKEYINPNMTRLHIELDVFETRMFQYELGECFVEREHQDRIDDAKSSYIFNLENENLEIGPDYKMIFNANLGTGTNNYCHENIMWYYVWDTIDSATGDQSTIAKIKGYDTNLNCRLVPILSPKPETRGKGIKYRNNFIEKVTDASIPTSLNSEKLKGISKLDTTITIQACRYPPFMANVTLDNDGNYVIASSDEIFTNNAPDESGIIDIWVKNQNNQGKLVSHTEPIKDVGNEFDNVTLGTNKSISREPKLKTHPYKYIRINYGDQSKNYKFEEFKDNIDFKLYKSVAPNSSTIIYPVNYSGDDLGHELISVNDNEQALRNNAWISYYNNNKASLRSGLLTRVGTVAITTGIGVASKGVGLAMAGISAINTASGVIQEMQKRQDIKETPDGIRTTGDDLGAHLIDDDMFGEIEVYEIKPQFKTKVFNYFYRLGYTANCYKTPDLKSRYYFNFIKLSDVVFKKNNLNKNDADIIKDIYKNGTTIWHYRDANTFDYLNYNLENWENKLL